MGSAAFSACVAACVASGGSTSFNGHFASILPGALQVLQSDLGLTTGTTWTLADQSGNGKDATATGAARPSVGTGVGGKPSLLNPHFAGGMSCASLNLPAPGTTPWYMCMVAKVNSALGGERLCGAVSADNIGMLYVQTTPSYGMTNPSGGPATSGVAFGTFALIEAYFSNSTSDFIKVGSSAQVTGTNSGNNVGTGRIWMNTSGLTQGADMEGMMCAYLLGLPSSGTRATLRAAITSYYGGTVSV
jgi:hypothetical protein